MYLILLLLSVSLVMADSIGVAGQRAYELHYSKDQISVQTPVKKVEIKKAVCNQRIFQDFDLKIKKLHSLSHEPGHKQGEFNYFLDKKAFRTSKSSSLAILMDSFPEEIERMKIEEKLRCK